MRESRTKNQGARKARSRLQQMSRRAGALAALASLTVTASGIGTAPPAHASLLGGVTGLVGGVLTTTTGLVNGLVGVVLPGWDDGATTPPVAMSQVASAIGADQLWARGYTGSGIGVALIDSGVAPVEGVDGPGKIVNGPDLSFESQSPDAQYLDTYGHGTHMAGIIAGQDDSGGSFRGVAPGAHVVALKAATHDGATDVSQVVAGINWVVEHKDDPGMNIRVLNLSFGTDGLQSYQLDPITYAAEVAWRHGIVVVVAGGNDGTSRSILANPATDPYVLSVGAADLHGTTSVADDTVAPFSDRNSSGGRTVDLIAPGVSIESLRNPGSAIDDAHPGAVVDTRFFRGSGTSQAAAVTSGAVALLLSARPTLTPDKVKALLTSNADLVASADHASQGAGRLDVNGASLAPVPLLYRQSFALASGLGSLERSRGTSHVAMDGVELTGEQDIMGSPWLPAAWAPAAAAGTTWNGGIWNGNSWTGSCWCGVSWAGATWDGKSWTGKSWTGSAWTGSAWTGKSWTGKSWTGTTWTGTTWTGKSWTGKSWTSS